VDVAGNRARGRQRLSKKRMGPGRDRVKHKELSSQKDKQTKSREHLKRAELGAAQMRHEKWVNLGTRCLRRQTRQLFLLH